MIFPSYLQTPAAAYSSKRPKVLSYELCPYHSATAGSRTIDRFHFEKFLECNIEFSSYLSTTYYFIQERVLNITVSFSSILKILPCADRGINVFAQCFISALCAADAQTAILLKRRKTSLKRVHGCYWLAVDADLHSDVL